MEWENSRWIRTYLKIHIEHIIIFFFLLTEVIDFCAYEVLSIACPTQEVIVVTSASFGRMEQGRCIRENEFIGCENDVLFLADRWCSGRNRCDVELAVEELEAANDNCRSYLKMYTSVEYTCLKGKLT